MPRLFSVASGALLALVFAASGLATVPAPPDQVAYSGVLLDGGGIPLAGPVDLAARIYDAASAGTLVFKQSFTGVALEDGHFTLNLGPTGVATDSPTNPLTTSLRTALTSDLAAGTGRFVEITVDTDPPLARVALVLVPYAMQADHATTSDVATNALDAEALTGVDGAVLTQLLENFDEDDSGVLLGGDPSEGTADPDGDGIMNFIDPNNDNDGISDRLEYGNSNINLVTPSIPNITPNTGLAAQVTAATVTGTGFLPGLTATLGTQTFTPGTVTPTSFSINAGPQAVGTKDLVVTNANGETGTRLSAFTFLEASVTLVPLYGNIIYGSPVQLVARGEQLLATGRAGFGSNPNRYSADTIVDGNVVFDIGKILGGIAPSLASWNSSRVIYGLRGWATTDQVQLLRDNNGDNLLVTSEAIVVESPGVDPQTQSPSFSFDASDRPGGGYLRNVAGVITAVAFHDRDGNGSFGGTNEVVAIEPVTGATDSLGEAAFDPSGRLAYVYYDSGAGVVRAAWDRSGDGDFGDTVGGTPELVTVAATPTPFCFGMTFDTAGRLAVTYTSVDGGANALQLRRDLTGDGDFDDAGEGTPSGMPSGCGFSFACDVGPAATGNRVFVVANGACNGNDAQPRLFLDMNDDGDYLDAGETETLTPTAVNGPFAIAKSASGGVRLLTGSGVLVGPVR